jgi:mono/diheme cytochrome c family protein
MRHCGPKVLSILLSLATLASACNRADADDAQPLGARMVGQAATPVARAMAPGSVPDPASLTASLAPASYTADQAARGAQAYRATCARCHAAGTQTGAAFATAWGGRRVYDLYSTLTNTMPQDNPGSLHDDQYADVVAYLLQMNHVPAGQVALRPDTAQLRSMRIDVASGTP